MAINRKLMACATVALLTGCTNQHSTPVFGQPANTLFPLEAGWQWTYRVKTVFHNRVKTEKYQVRTLPPIKWANGQTAAVRSDSRGNRYALKMGSQGIWRVGAHGELDLTWRIDPPVPERFVLRRPYKAGTYWQVDTVPYLVRATFDMPKKLRDPKRMLLGFQITDDDVSVKVPAGHFKHCLLAVGKGSFPVYGDGLKVTREVPVTQREWFCPGVGMVKLHRQEQVDTRQYQGGETIFELTKVTPAG